MASYKQPCMHCGAFIDSDAWLCISCGSMSPFGYLCPSCNKPIQKGQFLCSGCGRELYTICPTCGGRTFVQERCEVCGAGLMVYCSNKRCEALQFFENTKCTVCGKKIKNKLGR